MRVAYDEAQQELAHEFAGKLESFARRLRGHLCGQAMATALIGTGIQAALTEHDSVQVVEWLRSIADELERPDLERVGNA
ncbi:unnamed protein product [Phaeothamnion confervicola]